MEFFFLQIQTKSDNQTIMAAFHIFEFSSNSFIDIYPSCHPLISLCDRIHKKDAELATSVFRYTDLLKKKSRIRETSNL